MQINLSHIQEGGRAYEGEEPAGILDVENDPFVRAPAPVRYDLLAEVVSQELLVQGRVETELQMACSRCGEFFSTRVCDSSFLRAYELTGEVSLVDLDGDLREAILLKMPLFALCSPDCRGLCSQCGSNLNRGSCGCAPSATDGGAWSALDELKW